MSAGAFTRSFYVTNLGNKVPIRVQPETLTATIGGAANAGAAAPADSGFPSAIISGSRRGIGIHPRTVTFAFTGNPPAGYKPDSTYTIPVFSQSAWEAIATGTAIVYLTSAAEAISKNEEKIR